MAEKQDLYQHVPENTASDRVAEKAKLVAEKIKAMDKDAEDQRKLFPPAPKSGGKVASTK